MAYGLTPTAASDRFLVGALMAASVPIALQQTMVLPALPILRAEFGTSQGWVTWLFTGYLLVGASVTPVLGRLGDLYGRKRLLLIALGAFLLGSVGATVAGDIWSLIACRMIQGLGGAVLPLSFAIIKEHVDAERVAGGMALVASTVGFGAGAGLVAGGLLIDWLSWRWIFASTAGILGLAIALIARYVPESQARRKVRFEPRGPILLTLALVALLVGLTEGAHWGWTAPKTALVFTCACLLAGVWLRNELRVADPMMDVRMFVRRDVALTCATAAFAGVALFATFLAIPIFIETPNALPPELASLVSYGFGASPTRTGLYLMPAAIAGLLAGAIASRVERRYGTKRALVIAMMLELLGAVSLALWHDSPWQVALGVILLFAGFPAVGAVTTTLVVRTVRATEVGVASSMVQTFRAIGGVIGGQAGAAVLTSHTIHGTDVPTETAFVFAFLITAVVALLAVLFASFITVAGRPPTDDDVAIVQASLAQTLE